MLYIVSTPIGNLKDITFRAVETLKEVDLIAAEDTRRTKILLNHYEISKKMVSYNDINKFKRTPELIQFMVEGKSVALVSDCGTPGISDPGYHLINEAIKNKIQIIPIPGANAVISGLVTSGLPTDSFSFYGFLSKKEKRKRDFFNLIKDKTETIMVYESPHRINKTLHLMAEVIPNKNICVAREISKKFEEFIRGKPSEIIDKIGTRTIKGEIILIIGKENTHSNL